MVLTLCRTWVLRRGCALGEECIACFASSAEQGIDDCPGRVRDRGQLACDDSGCGFIHRRQKAQGESLKGFHSRAVATWRSGKKIGVDAKQDGPNIEVLLACQGRQA
jgi:hypothetical protein